MSKAYDVFKEDESGNRTFVETIIGLDQVRKALAKLAVLKPGKYVIHNPTEVRHVEPLKKSA